MTDKPNILPTLFAGIRVGDTVALPFVAARFQVIAIPDACTLLLQGDGGAVIRSNWNTAIRIPVGGAA